MSQKVSTRSKAAVPAEPVASASTATASTSTGRSSVTFPDVTNAAIVTDDPGLVDYDADEIMADVNALTEPSLPDTPGRMPDETDDELNDDEQNDDDETDEALRDSRHVTKNE